MQEKTSKNEGILSFLATVLKKSTDLPADVSLLAGGVKVLSERLHSLATSVSVIARAVQEHSAAINELYSMNAVIMQQMKSSGVDSKLPTLNKTKSDKPN